MTTITDAHRAEARRRLRKDGYIASSDSLANILAQALAEPAWQPPVDPDLIEARQDELEREHTIEKGKTQ